MVFSSLFFVFFFLVLNLIIYHLMDTIPKKNIVMLVFSLIFYSWSGPKYLILLCSMVFVSWICALLIDRYRDTSLMKIFLIVDLVILLGLLVVFKYLNFFTGITCTLFGVPDQATQIILPIGISFYTFQLISYVVDVYRNEVAPQRKYHYLLLYASLFHQCIAGPIVRYQLVADEIEDRHVTTADFCAGIKRFSFGLAKKAVLANGCAAVADSLFPDSFDELSTIPVGGLWVGLLFYMLEIYLDFSAYSDMAIGMGRMIGFHYDENFNLPYISGSIKEFWTRWHISLSTFFRDYVYIPLGGNRKGARRQIINLLIVWGLTGFWHGASWNYILWGLYFFVFINLENHFLGDRLKRMPAFISHGYALVVIYFGWALFRLEHLSNLGYALKAMFGANANGFMTLSASVTIKNHLFLLIFCILVCTPFFSMLGKFLKNLNTMIQGIPYVWYTYEMVVPIFMLFISLVALVGNSYNPFLYFQF